MRTAVLEIETIKARSSKDTKSWCKGVPGRFHRGEWFEKPWGWSYFTCTVCGRGLDLRAERIDLRKELRRIRKSLGLTQEEIAKKAKMKQEAISSIETDGWRSDSEVKLSTFRHLFDLMGYDIVVALRKRK